MNTCFEDTLGFRDINEDWAPLPWPPNSIHMVAVSKLKYGLNRFWGHLRSRPTANHSPINTTAHKTKDFRIYWHMIEQSNSLFKAHSHLAVRNQLWHKLWKISGWATLRLPWWYLKLKFIWVLLKFSNVHKSELTQIKFTLEYSTSEYYLNTDLICIWIYSSICQFDIKTSHCCRR